MDNDGSLASCFLRLVFFYASAFCFRPLTPFPRASPAFLTSLPAYSREVDDVGAVARYEETRQDEMCYDEIGLGWIGLDNRGGMVETSRRREPEAVGESRLLGNG